MGETGGDTGRGFCYVVNWGRTIIGVFTLRLGRTGRCWIFDLSGGGLYGEGCTAKFPVPLA